MGQILVLNENRLEREVTRSILERGLEPSEITFASEGESALKLMQEEDVDLLIADVPRFDLRLRDLMARARRTAPDTPILVTSVGTRKDVEPYVWRLGLQDYLLKPYRPAWLLEAVRVLRRGASSPGNNREDQRREQYLKLLEEHMWAFRYKKCMDTAKDYLDVLYKDIYDKGLLRLQSLRFAEGLARLGGSLGSAAQKRLSGVMEKFRLRCDRQTRKYDTYLVLEKMLDIIFSVFEENGSYQINREQKALNYIDRNIKGDINLDRAAEYANMSSYYYSRVFKKMTGVNFITYVTDRKIEIAQDMLVETDMPVINIAYELSYNEPNYFSKAFKRKVGMSPTEYREIHCGE